MKYLLAIAILALVGCADDVEVSGGTSNTLSVDFETVEAFITSDLRTCLRTVVADEVTDGACTDPSLVYDAVLTIADMKALRDYLLLPCTTEELQFLGASICG